MALTDVFNSVILVSSTEKKIDLFDLSKGQEDLCYEQNKQLGIVQP
jgi:hypothetical protein